DVRLYAFWRGAVDDAENSAALLGFRDDHLDRIRGGTENIAYLGDLPDAAQQVDGVPFAQGDDKNVPGRQYLGVLRGDALEFGVIAVHADQARARGLIERYAELHLRHRIHDGFVDILHGFDEMTLPDDNVAVSGDDEADGFQFHSPFILRPYRIDL